MRRHLAMLGLLAPVLLLSAGLARSQATETPRTPWGVPDLGGIWDYRSLTPLSRPDTYRNLAILSEAEAEAYVRSIQNARERFAPPFQRAFVDRGTDVVDDRRSSLIIDPPTGRYPPTVLGAAARSRAAIGSYADQPFVTYTQLNLLDRCIGTIGFPFIPGPYNNNVQIFQTPDVVALLAESVHFVRIIPLDGRPRSGLPQFGGDGRGHWDGDTLVVESSNFDGELAMLGVEPSQLVERFTRIGDTLQYEFTVNDPKMWATTWTARVPMKRSEAPLFEYACHEGNVSLTHMLETARALDR
jgi:hypothetical protein